MANTLNCPTCGAPLDYSGNGGTLRCPYCNNSVIVPEELRQATSGFKIAGHQDMDQTDRQQKIMAGVVVLAQTGKKIEAIKLYRQLTNAGLVEAKAAVENILAGKPIPSDPASNAAQLETQTGAAIPADQTVEIRRLIQSHQKIEAIKRYRKLTGVGLKEAKDAVEAMDVNGQLKKLGSGIKIRIIRVIFGLLFLGLASIFPITFGPMGVASWQAHQIGAAIGAFIGAGVWALVWGGIGLLIIFV